MGRQGQGDPGKGFPGRGKSIKKVLEARTFSQSGYGGEQLVPVGSQAVELIDFLSWSDSKGTHFMELPLMAWVFSLKLILNMAGRRRGCLNYKSLLEMTLNTHWDQRMLINKTIPSGTPKHSPEPCQIGKPWYMGREGGPVSCQEALPWEALSQHQDAHSIRCPSGALWLGAADIAQLNKGSF